MNAQNEQSDVYETKQSDGKKNKRPKTGFGLRLTQAIIFTLATIGLIFGAVFIYSNYHRDSFIWHRDFYNIFIILSFGAVTLVAFTALQFIGAYVGKKRKWGNILSIVLGAITTPAYLIGLFGLIGGVKGNKYLKLTAKEQTKDTQGNKSVTVPATNEPTVKKAEKPVPAAESTPKEYIKPRLSPKAQKAMMVIMIVSYALLTIAGILFITIEKISSMFGSIGICQEVSACAYGIVIGLMMLVGVPSIGYYFTKIAPVKLSKKLKIILTVITTLFMLALIAAAYMVIYFIKVDGMTINSYLEGSDTWFVPMSVAFAPIGLMICYLLTLFRINPEKIQTTKPEKSGDGLAAVTKHIFAMIIYGIVRLVKGILSFKEKQPEIFILVATILLTWLAFFTAFVFAIICIVVLVGVVIMYFTGVMSLAYTPKVKMANNEPTPTDEYYKKDEYSYVDSHGYTQTIYTDRNGKEARDAGGRYVGEINGDGSEKKFTPTETITNSNDDE